jgi:hypothetical protein
VSAIRRYLMKFAAYMAVCCLYGCLLFIWLFAVYYMFLYSSDSILYHCIYGCTFCVLLFKCVNYVFISLCLCILIVMYVLFRVLGFIVFFCVRFVCKCVLYYCHRVST